MKKGDRVSFMLKGELAYGVVLSGGEKTIKVMLDGGESYVTGAAQAFSISDRPVLRDVASAMDRWSVSGYKELRLASEETACFEARVLFDGKAVIVASNDGHGGPNNYEGSLDYGRFAADAKAWAAQFGWADATEAEDIWLDWYVNKRLYGVTAAAYLGKFGKEMAALSSK